MTNEDYSECIIKSPQKNRRQSMKQGIMSQNAFDRRENLSHH